MLITEKNLKTMLEHSKLQLLMMKIFKRNHHQQYSGESKASLKIENLISWRTVVRVKDTKRK